MMNEFLFRGLSFKYMELAADLNNKAVNSFLRTQQVFKTCYVFYLWQRKLFHQPNDSGYNPALFSVI